MPLQAGQILNNRYRIDSLLGEGGFGAVYRAWDTNFEMPCALKENTETTAASQRQFMREARILHTLRHPNLPLVKDYFLIQGEGQYLVMDYVEGDDLQTILQRQRGPLPESQVIDWLRQVCSALEYLHTQNPPVIHRDIKPANIRLTPEGKAMLVDFGICKVVDPEGHTTQGARAISPGYSPFEQYGHAPTDQRTDIYALGATAYTLLTGKIPVDAIARMAGSELPAPTSLNSSISSGIERVILRAMASMPAERYLSCEAFRLALEGLGERHLEIKAKAPLLSPETVVMEEPVELEKPLKAVSATEIKAAKKPEPSGVKQSKVSPGVAVMEDKRPMAPQRPAAKPAPVERARVEKRRAARWPWLVLAGGLVVVAILAARIAIRANQPPLLDPLSGAWGGYMQQLAEERARFQVLVEFTADVQTGIVRGNLEIAFPDGHREPHTLEGDFDGRNIRFHDDGRRFYHGLFDANHIGGVVSWDCYDCPRWAEFELIKK
jgi:serine/threonine-protein kinase